MEVDFDPTNFTGEFTRAVFRNAKKTKNLWSRLISAWTGGPYSHVELWLAGPKEAAVCFSAREGQGVRFKVIDLTDGQWDEIKISENKEDVKKILNFALPQVGMGYDWLGLLGFVKPWHISFLHDSDDRFCSEVCSEDLNKADLLKLQGLHPWEINPNKLAALLALQYKTPPVTITP